MPKQTAESLAASVDKVVAHLNGRGPRLTDDEVRATHRLLDEAEQQGVTAAEVRKHRRR